MPTAAEHAGQRRDDDPGDAELAGEVERMDAAIAAERHQREIARIAAALDGDGADGTRHVDVGHGADAVRGIGDIEPERVVRGAGAIACSLSALSIPRRAAGQAARIDEAQHDIGVGHGRPVVAEAVAGGTRNRAGRLRTDHQQTALVDAAIDPPPAPTSAMSIAGTLSM